MLRNKLIVNKEVPHTPEVRWTVAVHP